MAKLPITRGTVRAICRSRLVRWAAGARPVNDRGVQLDPQLHAMLGASRLMKHPRLDEIGAEAARVRMREEAAAVDVAPPRLHRVEDRTFDGPAGPLSARLYTPRPSPAPEPALVYLHGGGFVLGDLDTHDALCRRLAHEADLIVVALEYRLAPEHPFPAAADDVLAGWRWVRAHADELGIDPERIAVGGDSAGGNLAAVLCLDLREADEPQPALQLLVYPATDLTRSMDSHRTFASGFFLERETTDWFLANYLTDPSQETHPRASPLGVAELGGLAPAHVVVAGFDSLRDEGEAYAMRLMEAQVPTTLRCHGSLIHGFASMGGVIDTARWAVADLAAALRFHLHA